MIPGILYHHHVDFYGTRTMDTLMVRRLPDCLSESDLNLLFVRFGAQGVRREKRWPKGRSPIVFVK